jgi:hypothetical protein
MTPGRILQEARLGALLLPALLLPALLPPPPLLLPPPLLPRMIVCFGPFLFIFYLH